MKKQRDVLRMQLSLIGVKLEEVRMLRFSEANTRLNIIDSYWKKFDEMQRDIEGATERFDLEIEVKLRFQFDEEYTQIRCKIMELRDNYNLLSATAGLHSLIPAKLPAYTIQPLQEDEELANFLNRFDNMMKENEDIDPKAKMFMLMCSLTPLIYRKVFDTCKPRHPVDLEYEELVEILNQGIFLSTDHLAHPILGKVQQENELVTIYADTLKILACDCELKCANCGTSLADQYVLMQFIVGLRDPEIREKVLNTTDNLTLPHAIDLAMQYEIVKREEVRMENVTNDRQREYERFSAMLRGKCFRCGYGEHRASECKYLNTVCNYCRRVGHLETVCLRKAKSHSNINQLEESSDDSSNAGCDLDNMVGENH